MVSEVVSLSVEYVPAHLVGIGPAVVNTSSPRFSWKMKNAAHGAAQTAYQLQLVSLPRDSGAAGAQSNDDPLDFTGAWDSGAIHSSSSLFVAYTGEELLSRTRYAVRVRIRDQNEAWSEWSSSLHFETALLHDEWRGHWIAPTDDPGDDTAPPPLMTKTFEVTGAIHQARLYLSARGLAEVTINGSKVGDQVLSPGWTDYDYRAQYVTHDVTSLLLAGENTIQATVGDGWYSGRIAKVRDRERRFGNRPQFLAELRMITSEGEQFVCTDESWNWTVGPITASDIYDGETYDARIEPEGWKPVRVVGPALAGWQGEGKTILDAKIVPPVRRVQEVAAVSRTEAESGRHIFDLGQNITGWARVRLAGRTGQPIVLRFGEMLQADGTLYVENLRSALATDTCIPAEEGEFEWEPRFTFHGFRYVEVSGVEAAPALEAVVGIVLHNDMEPTGSFRCSSELVNQLQSNIQWGQRGNYLEAPTDCPQRDERLGWTGDAQVFIPTGAFNFNVAGFFAKWQRDLVDSQGPSGTIPPIAPTVRYLKPADESDGGPAWSDAFVICPWTVYVRYGDQRILAESYDAMRRFVDSMERRSRGLIRSDEFVVDNGGYGDWVSMDAPAGSSVGATPKDLIGTAYFARSVDLLRKVAGLLGKERDERELRDLHRRITAAFQAEYVTATGRVLGDTQTAYVVALAFDLLPEAIRQQAVDRLVRKLELRGWRLDTGFVGTGLLCGVLSRFGRSDVAARLLLQEQYPSWLYTVHQGATTMWERWNSYTHKDGFGPVSMNSFNHYAYGAVGDWMYAVAAGLSVDLSEPGEPPIRVAPHPGHGLDSAAAELETPFGRAMSSWRLLDRQTDSAGAVPVELTVLVPPNATARVELVTGTSHLSIDADVGKDEIEDHVVLEEASGGTLVFRVAAGGYRFNWSLPNS